TASPRPWPRAARWRTRRSARPRPRSPGSCAPDPSPRPAAALLRETFVPSQGTRTPMTDIEISTSAPVAPVAPAASGASGAAQAPAPVESVEALAGSPFVTVYAVQGMSCGHCAGAVTRELSALGGVDGVHVDLESKKVTVGSARRLSD